MGAREDGMPLRISEPERSEAPRAGAGEREDGSREGGWEPHQSDLGNTPPELCATGTQYPFLPTTKLASDETIEVMTQMSQVIFDHEPQRHRMVCSNAARILQDAFG